MDDLIDISNQMLEDSAFDMEVPSHGWASRFCRQPRVDGGLRLRAGTMVAEGIEHHGSEVTPGALERLADNRGG